MPVPDDTMNSTGSPVHALGLAELAEAIAEATISSVSATTDALDRIEASQPTLNAFRIVRLQRALAEAAAADRRIAAGERLPLLGVPIAIKDDTDIAGEPTAFGVLGDFEPKSEDAESVQPAARRGRGDRREDKYLRIRTAAVHQRRRIRAHPQPVGSAVHTGRFLGWVGSRGVGRAGARRIGFRWCLPVRIPAAWTNLVGIKPQRGRISTWPLPEAFNGLTVNGPLARTVADAALLLDAAAGPHPGDLHTPEPLTLTDAVDRDPGRLRIALSLNIPFTATRTALHPEVEAGVHRIAKTLRELGHSVTVRNLHYGLLMGASFLPRSMAGIRAVHDRMPGARVDPRTMANVRTGMLLSGPALFAARQAEALLHRRIGGFFDEFDVVLAPTTATPPPRAEEIDGIGVVATNNLITAACPYTWPWNVLGWPSINVPAGFTGSGLPVGAQLMGTANTEPMLVSLAAQLESELHWERHRPEPWW